MQIPSGSEYRGHYVQPCDCGEGDSIRPHYVVGGWDAESKRRWSAYAPSVEAAEAIVDAVLEGGE